MMEQSFFAWRVGERSHRFLLNVENRGVYRPESCLCWHAQAFLGRRVDLHSIAIHEMQKNDVKREDGYCFVSAADRHVF